MNIAGIDGEAIAPYGYCLLCSSSGEFVYRDRRITTEECFWFLLGQGSRVDRMFGYGIGYDVCHWIKDLTDGEKMRLAKTGRCYTMQGASFFRVRYIPSVLFEVSLLKGFPFDENGKQAEQTALVVDLMRWHRKPFVDVCREWGTSQLCGSMQSFKDARSGFHISGLPEIRNYCLEECRATARLAEQMTLRLKDAGMPASHPFTSGSVAGQLAAKHKIHEYRREPPPEISEAVQRAFYGGREQVTRYGLFKDAVQWDLRSAYGWAMMQLPDLLGEWSRWIAAPRNFCGLQIRDGAWGLYKISWDLDEHRYPVMPFPHRNADGRIHYPPRGTGWYWSPVVRAALRHYQGDIRILDAWHYIPLCKKNAKIAIRPFRYIGDVYDQRREASKHNDPVEGLIKMLIVSTWGRLCSEGKRGSKTRGMLDWAGMTTALIHERMLDAINQTGQEHFISCCVDGFWTTSTASPYFPTKYDDQSIGQWSMKKADELLLIRPTVYWKKTDGEWTGHTSGFSHPEPPLLQWKMERNEKLRPVSRRCRGLLSSAMLGDFSRMGEFYGEQLEISLNPGFGRTGHSCPTLRDGDTWKRWLPYYPPIASIGVESFPFVSRTGITDNRWKEAAEGQAAEETMD